MLTSLQNPWVKHVRKLSQAKVRRAHQQFLLEGTHLIQEALAVAYPLVAVHGTQQWRDRHPSLWDALVGYCPRVELVSPEVLTAMATTVNPDGVVAVAAHQPVSEFPAAPSLAIAAETLQDPGNLGTLIRTAAAVAAEGVWLSPDSVDPESPKVIRSSAGQWFRVPVAVGDLPQQLGQWRRQGVQVIGAQAQARISYWEVDLRPPTVILLGNEGAGLSAATLEQITQPVHIPQAAGVDSLNVAIAAAVMLY
ncbi:rRNA methyltransferase, partial [filamentous cyanobacterium CCP5]